MNPVKLLILCSALALAGCGDKNDADTAKSEGSPLDQAQDMTTSGADSARQDAGDAISNTPDNTQEDAASPADSSIAAAGDTMDSAADEGAEIAAARADEAADAAAAAADTAVAAGEEAVDNAEIAADAAADASVASDTAAADNTIAADTATAENANDAAAASAVAPAAGGTATEAELSQGQTIYQGKCQACHATGAAGAPKLGDKDNWAPRIAQGMDVLVQRAIEGYKGSVGYMPPKGGFTALTDDEVKMAVAYMVSQSQ